MQTFYFCLKSIANWLLKKSGVYSPRRLPFKCVANAESIFPALYQSSIRRIALDWKFGHLENEAKTIFLCSLIKTMGIKNIFEFGTFTGRTTYQLALNLPDDGSIHTLDIQRDVEQGHLFKKGYGNYTVGSDFYAAEEKIRRKIHQHLGNSVVFDYRNWFGQIDLVFIDGGHQYPVVHSDSRNALKMVRPGGIIVWDDYGIFWPEVRKALHELAREINLFYLEKENLVVYIHEIEQ
jgi:predicted O-methyltransferase YrrM